MAVKGQVFGANGESIGGGQHNPHFYERKALIEARKEQYFGQLADVKTMPKNSGKEIKQYHYIPMLDDANINDQGIDASGVTIDSSKYEVRLQRLVETFAVEADATAAAAAVNAVEASTAVKSGSSTPWTVTFTKTLLVPTTQALANAVVAAVPGSIATRGSGNLYGSSKDIGSIPSKLPVLSETGGRVNRVGFTRKELNGTFEKFGFFTEFSADLMNFDSDAELDMHLNRELINGAMEIDEDMLQIDLINNAGVIRYTGTATSTATVSHTSNLTYKDLMQLSTELDNNRCPKQTTVITGTRMVDTKTLPSCRVLYIGSELKTTIESLTDYHGQKAFVPVQQYAAGTTVMNGEWGAVGEFRIIVVPEMMKWAGAGANATDATYYATNDKYDVFPMLVVGQDSFTTIGFQTDGKGMKFNVLTKKPGKDIADRNDPYGELGFSSIKWWYGFMLLRGERLALIKTAAKM